MEAKNCSRKVRQYKQNLKSLFSEIIKITQLEIRAYKESANTRPNYSIRNYILVSVHILFIMTSAGLCIYFTRPRRSVFASLCILCIIFFYIYIYCIQVNVKHAKGTCNVMCVTLQYFKLQFLEHQCSFDCYTLYCSCIYYNCMFP